MEDTIVKDKEIKLKHIPEKFLKTPTDISQELKKNNRSSSKNQKYMLAIAKALSNDVILPESVTCCGFAGDKGFTLPELNASALSGLKEEIKDCICGISNSRTCEIGLSYHSGLTYYSAFDLLDKHSTVK